MSLSNLTNTTARIVGKNTLGRFDGDYGTPENYASCGCNVARQAPVGFKPVIETEPKHGGAFYKFNVGSYEKVKGEFKPSFWSIFKLWK